MDCSSELASERGLMVQKIMADIIAESDENDQQPSPHSHEKVSNAITRTSHRFTPQQQVVHVVATYEYKLQVWLGKTFLHIRMLREK